MEDLVKVCEELRKNGALMAADKETGGGKLRAALSEQDFRMKVGQIGRQEKEKDFHSAAAGYENLANQSEDKVFAEKAFENAFSGFLKAGEVEGLERVGAAWLKRFPKSAKVGDALKMAATHFLIQGNFAGAARFFDKVGRSGMDPDALETAGKIWDGVGDLNRALTTWSAYLELFPKSPDRFAVALAMARGFETAKREGDAAKAYQYCMTGGGQYEAVCGARLADLYLRAKDVENARVLFKRISSGADKKKGEGLSPFVAYGRFRLAESVEERTVLEPLKFIDQKQLKNAITQRLAFIETLSRAYLTAVEAGGPWGIAALYRLAGWVMRLGEDLEKITPPAAVTGENLVKFRKNIEGISTPLKRKALATWAEAYTKALNAEVLAPAIVDVTDELTAARMGPPAVPTRAQGPRGKFRIAGIPADGGEEGRPKAMARIREKLLKNPQDSGAWLDYGNLLWGEGKPVLAKLGYARSLELAKNNPAALNNLGVVSLGADGEDDWLRAAESLQSFNAANHADTFFMAAKFNRALMLNYYRLFAKAKPLWEQVLAKEASAEGLDGMAVVHQALGDRKQAESFFEKSNEAGAKDSRFTYLFHKAARAPNGEKCLDELEDLEKAGLQGFEKLSVERLNKVCQAWKK